MKQISCMEDRSMTISAPLSIFIFISKIQFTFLNLNLNILGSLLLVNVCIMIKILIFLNLRKMNGRRVRVEPSSGRTRWGPGGPPTRRGGGRYRDTYRRPSGYRPRMSR